jgi:hypothetical protein
MPTNTDRIRKALQALLSRASASGQTEVKVISGEFHNEIDFIPGSHPNQMPSVCNIMHEFLRDTDIVLHETPSGKSSTLAIAYRLPR